MRIARTLLFALTVALPCSAQHALLHGADPDFPLKTTTGDFGSASIVGDLNQDGYDDVLVGDGNADRVYAFSGRSGAQLWMISEVSGSGVGNGLLAGLRRPGGDNVLIGCRTLFGSYQIRSGSTGTLIQVDTLHPGITVSPAPLGDVDQDGNDDFLAGVGPISGAPFGRLYVVSGTSLAPIRMHEGTASSPFSGLNNDGPSASVVGDLNGDGVVDYAMALGLPDSTSTAGFDIYSGATGSLILSERASQPEFGQSVTLVPAGDFDGDGTRDVTYRVRKTDFPLDTVIDYALYSGATGLRLPGFGLPGSPRIEAPLDDLNGDGRNEFLGRSIQDPFVPAVFDPVTQSPLFEIRPVVGEAFTAVGAGLGDVNSDGVLDFAVGISGDGQFGAPGNSPARFVVYSPDLDPVSSEFCFGDGGASPGCTPCPCGNDASAADRGGCLNPQGSSGHLLVAGDTSIASGHLTVDAERISTSTFAMLISGQVALPGSGPCPAGSGVTGGGLLDGLRCVGGQTVRHGVRVVDGKGNIGLNNPGWGGPEPPVAGLLAQGGAVAGQERYFQIFYRVSPQFGCLTGLNTTNAVSVSVHP